MTRILIFFFCLSMTNSLMSQDQDSDAKLPYHSIPEYPEEFNTHTVAARMIDGLGYRYYWATEGLRDEDLSYRASETSRTTMETMVHIYNLSKTIKNGSVSKPNISGVDEPTYSYDEYRTKTLENLMEASNSLKALTIEDMDDLKVIFQRGERSSEFPYWNMINGPIADAIWHAGQIVAFRRASGNPLNPNVSVFNGKNRK